jgi:hypothetical protein
LLLLLLVRQSRTSRDDCADRVGGNIGLSRNHRIRRPVARRSWLTLNSRIRSPAKYAHDDPNGCVLCQLAPLTLDVAQDASWRIRVVFPRVKNLSRQGDLLAGAREIPVVGLPRFRPSTQAHVGRTSNRTSCGDKGETYQTSALGTPDRRERCTHVPFRVQLTSDLIDEIMVVGLGEYYSLYSVIIVGARRITLSE